MVGKDLLIGIDIGTTDTKCTVYSLRGEVAASYGCEYPMRHPQSGWAEENTADWWNAVTEGLRHCLKTVPPARIAAIGVSCTNTFIPVDRAGNALHNAIMQIDQRAADEVDWLREHIGEERFRRVTGNRLARGTYALPTLRWFIRNRPDIVDKAYKFLVPSGLIICKLTGEFTINESRMGFTLLSDIRTGRWDDGLCRDAGVDPRLLPRPCKAYEIAGRVTAEAAALTGLEPGTPVVGGAMDTVAAAVGAGAVEFGDVFMAIGTCGRLCYIGDGKAFDHRLMNCRNAFPGQYLSIEATNAAGISLRWFRDQFGTAARPDGDTRPIYDIFNELAQSVPPGAGGLTYLPYLSGERSPIWDPYARGVFFGMSLSTGCAEMIRAIMEGVAFSIREGIEILKEQGCEIRQLSLGGGVANSTIWCHIFADILGYPVIKLELNETETLGDAVLAGYGVGLIQNPVEFAQKISSRGKGIQPNALNQERYNAQFALYRKLYASLKDDFISLNQITQTKQETGFEKV